MRFRNIEIFTDTMKIAEQGYYVHDFLKKELKLNKEQMHEASVYLPDEVHALTENSSYAPEISGSRCVYTCENADSYTAAINKYAQWHDAIASDVNSRKEVLVLNFANPVNPGGGVRKGARAQEEDLCRRSTLLLSLEGDNAKKYYTYNRSLDTFMGSDAMILSPYVEIIKDEKGEPLPDTVVAAVLTCAAPMITPDRGKEGMSEAEYVDMLDRRIKAMVKFAAVNRYRYLILGAWGCGAFDNDAKLISDLFRKAFDELNINGADADDLFAAVDFAVLDSSADKYNFNEFYRNFGE